MLENLPGVNVKSEKPCYWNLCKEGGWEEYKRISDEKSEAIDKLVEDTALDIDEVMDKVEKIQDKIKFGAFGKTTKKMRNKPNVMDTAMSNEAEDIINKQRRVAEEHLRNLSECNQGRVGKIFQIRKSIQGCKKGAMEAQAVKDPLTGKLAVSNKEIQEVSLNYCKSVLMNNEPRDEYKREVMMKEQIHEERMKENAGSGFEVTRELFDKVVKKFKSNNKRSYDFILNGGDKFKEAIFKFAKMMIENESFPTSFNKTILNQIWKQKGDKSILKNNRYIHGKDWLPRLVESMVVVGGMKEKILASSTPFQIGRQEGNRPQQHLFVIRSAISRCLQQGIAIIIQLYDLSAFFDKESLRDVMNTLYEVGVDSRAYRSFFLLNKDTNIQVKTGTGMSEVAEVGEIIAQGSAGGALVSQVNLDIGVNEMFQGSSDEASYGHIRLQPIIFQDDILRVASSVEEARAGNVKLDAVMGQKQLVFNGDKTGYIIFGTKKEVRKYKEKLSDNPLMCGSIVTKEKVMDKYLGDILHTGHSLESSVLATIKDREGKVKAAMFEALAIVEDFRAQSVGGMQTALDLWKVAILPTLLYNSSTWTEMGKEAVERLEELQNFYIWMALHVPLCASLNSEGCSQV